MLDSSSTYVVELTPPGRAAVAVVLVDGPDAVRAVGECFHALSGRKLSDLPLKRIALGRWGGTDGEELIICRRSENQVEIHCHGGAAAVAAIVSRLTETGFRRLSWREWLKKAGGRVPAKFDSASPRDATTGAAEIALAEARTARTAAILFDQYEGALSCSVRTAIKAIESADWRRATDILDDLLRYRELGLHLTTPWRVVLAGAPNVGKSSLINALAGYERAIVFSQPGTTRDVVTTTTAIAGWPVQLSDTAGLRQTADELESAGVALAENALLDADLVVLVHDANDAQSKIAVTLPSHVRLIRVCNKIDLVEPAARQAAATAADIATSAVTGEGVADLVQAVAARLAPDSLPDGAAIPFAAAQVAMLEAARRAVAQADKVSAVSALNAMLRVES